MPTFAPKARVSLSINAEPSEVYRSFIEPERLTKFWLSKATGPLRVGTTVEWHFMVEGAVASVQATRLVDNEHVAWRWEDGGVDVTLEARDGGTVVTLVQRGFKGWLREQGEAAVEATSGFTIVLCDLKLLLETGTSPGLTKSKAALITAAK